MQQGAWLREQLSGFQSGVNQSAAEGWGREQHSLPRTSGRAPGRTPKNAKPKGESALIRTPSGLARQRSLMLIGIKGSFIITSEADWPGTS